MTDPSFAALSLSDIAGVVAVVGILLAPLTAYLRWLHQRITLLTSQLNALRATHEALAGSVGRGFASATSVMALELGVLDRSLKGRLTETDPDELLAALTDVRRGVERAWAEATALSRDPSASTSALQQLAGRLGDDDSARIIRLMRETRSRRS